VRLAPAVYERLERLLQPVRTRHLARLRGNVASARKTLVGLGDPPEAAEFLALLTALDEIAGLAPQAAASPESGGDHGYGDFFKLCRSISSQWGPFCAPSNSQAFCPQLWALYELLAETDRDSPWRVLEVGGGTGGLSWALRQARPQFRITLFEPALESLCLACALLAGQHLVLPRRVSFATSPSGIGWFTLAPPALKPGAEVVLSTVLPPRRETFDAIVAINSLSLAPDPAGAIAKLVPRLSPGGVMIWIDLVCWRVETPAARRIRGVEEMVAILERCGLTLERTVGGIPYLEDWGFERCYEWRDHLVLARKPSER